MCCNFSQPVTEGGDVVIGGVFYSGCVYLAANISHQHKTAMSIVLLAIFPTIALLVLGNVLKRRTFVPVDFWAAADRLTYFILFPSLLLVKVSQVDLTRIQFAPIFAFVGAYFVAITLLAWVLYWATSASPKQFSSIYQGVLRFNSYVYFAIIEAVWGQGVLGISALIAGVVIPVVNVCCIAAFSVFSGGFALAKTLKTIAKNPLIISTVLGFVVNLYPVLLPQVGLNTLAIASKAALPLALLSVGAAVQINSLFIAHAGFSKKVLWLGSIARLCLAPAIAWLVCYGWGIQGDIKNILVLFAAVPTATSSYILSKQLHGDAEMMAALISLQTVLSIVSLVFWLGVLTATIAP